MGHCPAEGHIDSGWQLGLPALVVGPGPAGPGSESTHADAENDENPGDGERTSTTQLTRHQVSQPASSEGCSAVVSTIDPPGSRTLALDAVHHSLHNLESPGHDRQAAQPTDVQTGNSLDGAAGQISSRDTERPGQGQAQGQDPEVMTTAGRQKLRACILQLTLGNTSTVCYANSALLCYLWASLSRVEFQLKDWGTLSVHLWELLHSASDMPLHLNHFSWFQSLVDTWSERYSQADSAEFTHRLLTRVDTPIASNAWRRMVLMGENATIHDQGACHMPITLQLDPNLVHHDDISLDMLLRHWHNELGMTAGLTDDRDLVVLHLDRFIQSPSGRLRKMYTAIHFCWTISLPLIHDDATCHWDTYQVIAAFAHFGGADHGHYQALLKTFPEVADMSAPTMWLYCDDNRPPERRWTLPEDFEKGITCFWLCKTSKLELHVLPPAAPTSADPTEAAVLSMLSAQPALPHHR